MCWRTCPERHVLADLPIEFTDGGVGDKGVLMRFIDDSLFVTTSEKAAVEFVRRLNNTYDEYGIKLNAQKTSVNFECNLPRVVSDAGLPTLNPCMPWCGVLVDTVTMEFYADYEILCERVADDCDDGRSAAAKGEAVGSTEMHSASVRQTHQ